MKTKSNEKPKPTGKKTARKSPAAKPADKPGDWAGNMQAAAARWGIPKAVQVAAKAAGCDAFQLQRVNGPRLIAWIKENPGIVDSVAAAAADKGSDGELRRERIRMQIALMRSKLSQQDGTVMPRETAKNEWARALGILQDEAKALFEPDLYRVWCERTKARIGELHSENQSLT